MRVSKSVFDASGASESGLDRTLKSLFTLCPTKGVSDEWHMECARAGEVAPVIAALPTPRRFFQTSQIMLGHLRSSSRHFNRNKYNERNARESA
jgi:hypothetical protein